MKKTDYELAKEEIIAAVQREQAAEAQENQQEANCRERIAAAHQEQKAALESGNMEQYRDAGLAAESARLELEFCEKRKRAGRKPAANQDDDHKICSALNAEEIRIKTESLSRVKDLCIELKTICDDALIGFNEINKLYSSWKNIIMKDNDIYTRTKTEQSRIGIGMIKDNIEAILYRLN